MSNFKFKLPTLDQAEPRKLQIPGREQNIPSLRPPELFGNCETDDDSEPTRTHPSDVYAFGCLYYEVGNIT